MQLKILIVSIYIRIKKYYYITLSKQTESINSMFYLVFKRFGTGIYINYQFIKFSNKKLGRKS